MYGNIIRDVLQLYAYTWHDTHSIHTNNYTTGNNSDHPYTPLHLSYMLEVNTINESVVMPKIAGTLSNANNTSLSSTHTKQRNKGVARRLPFSIVKKLHRAGAYMCIIRVCV